MDFKAYREWEKKRERGEVPPHHGKLNDDDGTVRYAQSTRHGNS